MKQHPSDIQQYWEPYILSAGCRLGQVWAMYISRVSFPAMNSGPGGGRSSHQLSKPRGGKMRKMLLCFSENEAQRGCVFSSLPNFLDLVDILWYTYISYVSYVYDITFLWISKTPQQKSGSFLLTTSLLFFSKKTIVKNPKDSSRAGLRLVPFGEAKELEQQIKAKEKQKAMAEMDRREAGDGMGMGRRWDGDGDGDGWVVWIVGRLVGLEWGEVEGWGD